MPSARIAAIDHSQGVLNFTDVSIQASGDAISARYTLGRSPPVSRNTARKRATIAGGGTSPAKCRASLVATCVAVAGFTARSRKTAPA